jgi:hypothetical protein
MCFPKPLPHVITVLSARCALAIVTPEVLHFGLHFFCGGGYSGCVSLNVFSASFFCLSFALRRCNFLFWDRVNPAGHHRGMEYFGSAVLMVAVSFSVVLDDSPKIIGPLLSPCMTTSAVPILMMSFFVVL